ncbi:MAG: RNA polymerase sigma factor [Planctomycetales bacterium]|nr:RNA polymerase sigma factor [Planctomycetales bacterium]
MSADDCQLDSAVVAALYSEHAEELRRFLVGVLRDAQLAQDVLQATFVKLVERGSETREESRKSWLFRVAFHEAMAIRRRQGVGDRIVRRVAEEASGAAERGDTTEPVESGLVRAETVERVRGLLNELPAEQARVVRMRIYEEKTFAEISSELGIPLGTALWRMQKALAKLKSKLDQDGWNG